ncbi:hypothetical protein [Cupriavidus sp. H18C2]|uniref:hypothetical protein n=1 Tax=Cupriavidus sp. H18C2 TaxID=3241602 RepID=UPI003BF885A2
MQLQNKLVARRRIPTVKVLPQGDHVALCISILEPIIDSSPSVGTFDMDHAEALDRDKDIAVVEQLLGPMQGCSKRIIDMGGIGSRRWHGIVLWLWEPYCLVVVVVSVR